MAFDDCKVKLARQIPTKHHEGSWKGVAQSHGQAHIVCWIEIPHVPMFLSQPEDTGEEL